MTRRRAVGQHVGKILTIVLVAMPAIAEAWNEPDGFRGLPWGTRESRIRLESGWAGCDDLRDRSMADRVCVVRSELGPAEIRAFLFLRQAEGLQSVFFTFDPTHYDAVRAIFLERYGEPTRRLPGRVRNLYGVERDTEELQWIGQRASVSLRKYDPKNGLLADSQALVSSTAGLPNPRDKERALEEERERANEVIRRGAKGL